jgi:hypothetical protein
MPWVLMTTSARCDGAAAARSMQPLMPELRQVLLIWQREFGAVRHCPLVRVGLVAIAVPVM